LSVRYVFDARISSAAFGTTVLHLTPNSASAGLLALVCNGDRIKLSVKARRIISWLTRLSSSAAPPKAEEKTARGYARLYAQEILGADQGCDFAFLKPR
jgi:dihydroxy-acid dehydratase